MGNYQNLDAWKTAMQLVKNIYILPELKFQELIPLLDNTIKLLNGLINYNEKAAALK